MSFTYFDANEYTNPLVGILLPEAKETSVSYTPYKVPLGNLHNLIEKPTQEKGDISLFRIGLAMLVGGFIFKLLSKTEAKSVEVEDDKGQVIEGEIEEDADMILMLHRDRESLETTLRVAKNRNGPCGKMDMVFYPTFTRFEQVES